MKSNSSPLRRVCGNILAAATLLLTGLAAPSAVLHAATYTVNVLTDTKPKLGGAGSGLTGDLRYCITQANLGASGTVNTITFAVTGTTSLSSYELVINGDLTIKGPGIASLTLNGGNLTRIFYIAPNHTVAISGLTLTHGNGADNDATGLDTNSGDNGGAIFNDESALTVTSCAFSNNSASNNYSGGAIYNNGTNNNASLTVVSCTFTDNSCGSGGGIFNNSRYAGANLTVTNSTFKGNSAQNGGQGGGICNNAFEGPTIVSIGNSVITQNTAGSGGGIYSYALGQGTVATVTVTNCTLTGNTASGGGGILTTQDEDNSVSLNVTRSAISGNSATGGDGGGILNSSGTATLINSTIGGNTASGAGGGFENDDVAIIGNCTINGNKAATTGAGIFNTSALQLNNSTLVANIAQTSGGGLYNSSSTTIANSTICDNSSLSGAGGGGVENDGSQGTATVTFSNTILALNTTGADYGTELGGVGVSGSFNLCDDDTCASFFTATGDMVDTGTAPVLQVNASGVPLLQNNGGLTDTVGLVAETGAISIAINKGKAAIDPTTGKPATTDQRGLVRPYAYPGIANATGGDGSDIGAFEAEPQYTLTITATNGTVTPNPSEATYNPNTQVVLTASAATDFQFTGWSGNASGSANPLTIIMTASKSITATFTRLTAAINVAVSPAGSGTVSGGGTFGVGLSTQITAIPASGWAFVKWSDGVTTNPRTVIVPKGGATYTADFTPLPPSITSGTETGDYGTAFSYQIKAAGVGPITYSTGTLPLGLELKSSGLISGVFETAGDFTVDLYGSNVSGTGSGSLTLDVDSRLAVTTGTGGTTAPSGTLYRPLDSTVTIAATPTAGYLFKQWSGGSTSSSDPLAFSVDEDSVPLHATFVSGTTAQGSYYGLVSSGTTQAGNSGFLGLGVGDSGAFSGNITVGGVVSVIQGTFFPYDTATVTIPRTGLSSLVVTMDLNLAGATPEITGSLTNGALTGDISAALAPVYTNSNPSPRAGLYTLALYPSTESSLIPAGTGYATMTVSSAGTARYAGTLADGTPLLGSAAIGADGILPVYSSLYAKQGVVIGTVKFESPTATGLLRGQLDWLKPATTGTSLYPAGFSTQLNAIGSSYSSALYLTGTEGALAFADGNLTAPFNQPFTLNASHTVVIKTPNRNSVTFSLNANTGVFSGTFIDAESTQAYHGVILQQQNAGAGLFLDSTGSGAVDLDIFP